MKHRVIVRLQCGVNDITLSSKGVELKNPVSEFLWLRQWCRKNAKGDWRTTILTSTQSQASILFEFDSKKDAFAFKLVSGMK